MKKFKINISIPWNFTHPNGTNVFESIGVGVIEGSGEPNCAGAYYLLNVINPFVVDGEVVKQIICAPRYTEHTMDMMLSAGCVVGVGRIKPGFRLNEQSQVNLEEIEYFAIGSIQPS